jgi:SAM-dependent methyltransferase
MDDPVELYGGLLDRHGVAPQAVGWGSVESQQQRFRVLMEVLPASRLDSCRVLDVGCGLGDLYGWLADQGHVVDYTGVDVTPAMVSIAKNRFPEGRFFCTEVEALSGLGERFDVAVMSGIFSYMIDDPYATMTRCLRSALGVADVVAFNVSSTVGAIPEAWPPNELLADAGEVWRLVAELGRRFVVRHDYAPHDLTAYLYGPLRPTGPLWEEPSWK